MALEDDVKAVARELGFDAVGIASAEPYTERAEIARRRLQEGFMGDLPWYTEERVDRGANPRHILSEARSLISLAMNYLTPTPESPPVGGLRGQVSSYAWGADYHTLLQKRLRAFTRRLPQVAGRAVHSKAYVDTGALQDRAVAERAGVGWFGKNTNILTSQGSWVFLAEVLTDLDLAPDPPLRKTCGRCTACIQACPTGALVAPYVLDSRRCISYLTIELREPVPRELRPLVGDWVFGCDICQDVCPVNRKATQATEYALFAHDGEAAHPRLLAMLELSNEGFARRFRGSPILRARPEGLKRNVCIALGNIGDPQAVPALARALRQEIPPVRIHAAWALGRIGGPEATRALEEAGAMEETASVREEIYLALEELRRPEEGERIGGAGGG